ncbi:MAG: cold-shock protein, partial [Alphaproteobacteria bacterium]
MATEERRPPQAGNFYRSGVTAKVKWFNPEKGFGFVSPDDGSPDAFLHASAVKALGRETLPEGATVDCDISKGTKGPQVALIHAVDESTVPRPAGRPTGRSPGRPGGRPAGGVVGAGPRSGSG